MNGGEAPTGARQACNVEDTRLATSHTLTFYIMSVLCLYSLYVLTVLTMKVETNEKHV